MSRGDAFHYHRPGKAAQAALAANRQKFRALRDHLKTLPQTREMSLALTHLQTAAMFANAAIALTDPEAEVTD
jgi:hypothetical protein